MTKDLRQWVNTTITKNHNHTNLRHNTDVNVHGLPHQDLSATEYTAMGIYTQVYRTVEDMFLGRCIKVGDSIACCVHFGIHGFISNRTTHFCGTYTILNVHVHSLLKIQPFQVLIHTTTWQSVRPEGTGRNLLLLGAAAVGSLPVLAPSTNTKQRGAISVY